VVRTTNPDGGTIQRRHVGNDQSLAETAVEMLEGGTEHSPSR
jgi:hypothetical protein